MELSESLHQKMADYTPLCGQRLPKYELWGNREVVNHFSRSGQTFPNGLELIHSLLK